MESGVISVYAGLSIACASQCKTLCRPALEHKPAIAIAAIDISLLVNLKKHAGMTQSGRTISFAAANTACPIAADTAGFDENGFGRRNVHSRFGLVRVTANFNWDQPLLINTG